MNDIAKIEHCGANETTQSMQHQLAHPFARARQFIFSSTKLPITRESRPELKNVRIASVGVQTIGSPRRLKEVFITTGTPVRRPNS